MVLMVTAFLTYGLLCLAFGTLSLPSPSMLLRLIAAGCLAALGQLSLLGAASRAPASRIAPAQYCQLIWASLIGAVIFAEVPDVVQMSGLVLLSIAGILVFRRGPQRVAS
jgi:drug/metabolite transporter (DMT)-like permease